MRRTFGQGVNLRLSWPYLAGFLSLTVLCGTSHEFVHHFAGGAACGGLGTKTFNSFDLVPGCSLAGRLVAALAGPIFTFALTWLGASWLRSPQTARRQLGFALIFANFPINRLLFVLLHGNDEHYAAFMLWGEGGFTDAVAILGTWLIALPPIIAGYFAILNRPRIAWFLGFFILPFLFVFLFAGLFLENFLLLELKLLAWPLLGVPLLIVLVEVISLLLYARFKPAILDPGGSAHG